MEYDWFNIFNLTDFNSTGLISRTYSFFLGTLGLKAILVTKGNVVSMLYDGVFLPIQLNSLNPYKIDDRAVFIDENNDVWLGILNVD